MLRTFRSRHEVSSLSRRGLILCMTIITLVCITGVATPPVVDAKAGMVQSSPRDGEILEQTPDGVVVLFSEKVSPESSTIRLLYHDGTEIPFLIPGISDDGVSLTLDLPEEMETGTYTIVWDVTSTVDGERTQGYAAWKIGSLADGTIVTIPSTATSPGDVSQWVDTAARWLALAGLAALVAVWPIWTSVIRPALASVRRQGPAITESMHRFAIAAVVLALLGSTIAMVIHAQQMLDGSWFDKIMNTIGQTGYGHLWIARSLMIVLTGITLGFVAWWFTKHRPRERMIAWTMSLALPISYSLISHASDQPIGAETAIAVDILHLMAASIWGGGVLILAGVLIPALQGMSVEDRRVVRMTALRRFSAVTLVTWSVLALTGMYSAWLQVGNMTAMTTTVYGETFIAKMIIVALMIMLIAVGLILIRRRSTRTSWIITAQAVLIIAMLATVGQMTSLPPARDVLAERSHQISIPVEFPDAPSQILVAPGIAGDNHITLEVPGTYLPNETTAILNVSSPEYPELGTREVQLARVSGNNFEYHGTIFSMAGNWDITATLTEPGFPALTVNTSQTFGTATPDVDAPGIPWRFDTMGGVSAVILLLVGIGGIVTAIFAGRTPLRKESSGLGLVAIAIGCVVLLQARYDPILAGSESGINPDNLAMVERGETVYMANCISCHGAELRGDGPLAQDMIPAPADFSAPHTYVHTDEDLIYWVKNGKQGTEMPAFGPTLTDQEILDVLSFIENRQEDLREE